jgi:hypothetical protein
MLLLMMIAMIMINSAIDSINVHLKVKSNQIHPNEAVGPQQLAV